MTVRDLHCPQDLSAPPPWPGRRCWQACRHHRRRLHDRSRPRHGDDRWYRC